MIANGFKPVAWVGAVGAAALGCYMLSLRVASERADVASLERRIVATQQQIRALQTELGTRGRLQQLEQWNEEVLALSAPVSSQYLQAEVQLAQFSTTQPQPLQSAGEVRMASAEVPPAAAPVTPPPQRAVAERPAVAASPPIAQPVVQRASLTVSPQPAAAPSPRRTAGAAAPERRPAPATAAREVQERPSAARTPARTPVRVASAEARPAAQRTPVATSSRTNAAAPRPRGASLLDERTVRELGTAARAERRGGTGD